MALTDKLTAIADAVRAKTGGTELLTLDEIAAAISGISGGGVTCLAYDMGEFVLEEDTLARINVAINHNLGDTPDFVLIWTDDFSELTAENTAGQQCNLGYLWFDKLTGMTQRFTSSASGTSLHILLTLNSGDYRIVVGTPSSSGYAVPAPTKESFFINIFGSTAYWRAGITYKYFVSKAWWNIGGVAIAE